MNVTGFMLIQVKIVKKCITSRQVYKPMQLLVMAFMREKNVLFLILTHLAYRANGNKL